MTRQELVSLMAVGLLLLGAGPGCTGEVGGGAEDGVEVVSDADALSDSFAAELDVDEPLADDLPAASQQIPEGSSGWVAQPATAAAAVVEQIWIQPYTEVAAGEAVLISAKVRAVGAPLRGATLRARLRSPAGAVTTVEETGLELPASATVYVHQLSPPLDAPGAWIADAQLLDEQGNTLSAGPEASASVAPPGSSPASTSAFDSILHQAAHFGYCHCCSSRSCLATKKRGDCWAMSDWLHHKLHAAGYTARIIQYRTKYSSRHRTVQILQGGKWVDLPYRQYGIQRNFRNTVSRPGLTVIQG